MVAVLKDSSSEILTTYTLGRDFPLQCFIWADNSHGNKMYLSLCIR